MHSSGALSAHNVIDSYGVRPVINLKAEVEISSGDGTSIAPFKISTD